MPHRDFPGISIAPSALMLSEFETESARCIPIRISRSLRVSAMHLCSVRRMTLSPSSMIWTAPLSARFLTIAGWRVPALLDRSAAHLRCWMFLNGHSFSTPHGGLHGCDRSTPAPHWITITLSFLNHPRRSDRMLPSQQSTSFMRATVFQDRR